MNRIAIALAILTSLSASGLFPFAARAQPAKQDSAPPASVLFINVRVFDGMSKELTGATSVLVVGNQIKSIGGDSTAPEGATVIDGEGRTLMPGLIDNHWHSMFAAVEQSKLLTADIGYINLAAGKQSRATLLRGFTSVRDVGGPVFGLKKAIDEGIIDGFAFIHRVPTYHRHLVMATFAGPTMFRPPAVES